MPTCGSGAAAVFGYLPYSYPSAGRPQRSYIPDLGLLPARHAAPDSASSKMCSSLATVWELCRIFPTLWRMLPTTAFPSPDSGMGSVSVVDYRLRFGTYPTLPRVVGSAGKQQGVF